MQDDVAALAVAAVARRRADDEIAARPPVPVTAMSRFPPAIRAPAPPLRAVKLTVPPLPSPPWPPTSPLSAPVPVAASVAAPVNRNSRAGHVEDDIPALPGAADRAEAAEAARAHRRIAAQRDRAAGLGDEDVAAPAEAAHIAHAVEDGAAAPVRSPGWPGR